MENSQKHYLLSGYIFLMLIFILNFVHAQNPEYETDLRKFQAKEERGKSAFRFDFGANYSLLPLQEVIKHGAGFDFNFSFIIKGNHQLGFGFGTRFWTKRLNPYKIKGSLLVPEFDLVDDITKVTEKVTRVSIVSLFSGLSYKFLWRADPLILGLGTGVGYTSQSLLATESFRGLQLLSIFSLDETKSTYITIFPGIDFSYKTSRNFIFTIFIDYRVLVNTKIFSGAENTILQDSHLDVGIRLGQLVNF